MGPVPGLDAGRLARGGGRALEELHAWQAKLGEPPAAAPGDDPRVVLSKTIAYLENN